MKKTTIPLPFLKNFIKCGTIGWCMEITFTALRRRCHLFVRGTIYALSIFGAEYTSGRFLEKHELCPWNYNRCRWHINGLIRIDFFPFWFMAGLLFEHVLTPRQGKNC